MHRLVAEFRVACGLTMPARVAPTAASTGRAHDGRPVPGPVVIGNTPQSPAMRHHQRQHLFVLQQLDRAKVENVTFARYCPAAAAAAGQYRTGKLAAAGGRCGTPAVISQ